ncbi:MAG: hypothetical protein IH852_13340 [Bacteroidetes bacterium]|nr:hypothetical protein [Bacteroidota bacterium]
MKILLIILMFAGGLSAQTFTVEKVSGDVKYQNGSSETWLTLKVGTALKDDAVISTGKNSSVLLKGNDVNFNLNESSAVSVSNIKKMNIDELLLALAMEDIMNAPKEIRNSSDNTAVYGTKEGESTLQIITDDFGIKRLNGAVQLAENSLEESAVVAAKETYRKYPDTKKLPAYRIYFANILNDKGLYEEALDEYVDIQNLKLTDEERTEINTKTESIKMKLLSE